MSTPNQGELARAINHDADESWPDVIEIVAHWSQGKRRSVRITADEFFGRGSYGAPMPGDRLIHMINQLRIVRPKPSKPWKTTDVNAAHAQQLRQNPKND